MNLKLRTTCRFLEKKVQNGPKKCPGNGSFIRCRGKVSETEAVGYCGKSTVKV